MKLITKYFLNLTATQIDQFNKLESIYLDWNSKINLISRKDIEEIYLKHVLHSLAIAKFIEFQNNDTVLDIGTGGGFPGIPLAILFPNTRFVLVDSIYKKINAVNQISKELNLDNVLTINDRFEKIKKNPNFLEADYFVTRAVADFEQLIHWCNLIKSKKTKSLLALKGGNLDLELKKFPKARIQKIKEYFTEPYFETKVIIEQKF